MSHTIVYLDVYCSKADSVQNPVYRIFLDDQLIVERQYWPETPDNFIQEQITLKDDDAVHSIWAKNVFVNRGKITTENVKFFDGESRKPMDLSVENANGRYTFKTSKR